MIEISKAGFHKHQKKAFITERSKSDVGRYGRKGLNEPETSVCPWRCRMIPRLGKCEHNIMKKESMTAEMNVIDQPPNLTTLVGGTWAEYGRQEREGT